VVVHSFREVRFEVQGVPLASVRTVLVEDIPHMDLVVEVQPVSREFNTVTGVAQIPLTPSTAGSLNKPVVGGVGSIARSLTSVARKTTVPYDVSEGGMNSAGGRRVSVPIEMTVIFRQNPLSKVKLEATHRRTTGWYSPHG
jgi:hypothetical protein